MSKKPAAPRWPGAKMVALDKIKPYDNNPRTHPPAQVALLARHLRQYGPDQPIVVDEDWVILKGHGRRSAAYEAGMRSFPVVQRRGLSEDDKRALRIADNQISLLSGWDHEIMRVEIGDLQAAGYDMPLLGFGDVELVQFVAGGPEPPGEFAAFGEDIPTDHECPKCGYKFSGGGGKKAPPPPATKPARNGGKAR